MDSSKDFYVVEKILGKRIYRKKVQYLLKWKGYPNSQNSWVDEKRLNCPDLLKKYESKASRMEDKIADIKAQSIKEEVRFLKASKMEDKIADIKAQSIKEKNLCNQNSDLQLKKILGMIRDRSGELKFLVLWENIEAEMVPTETIIEKWPKAVIQYYEDILYWESGDKISVGENKKNLCSQKSELRLKKILKMIRDRNEELKFLVLWENIEAELVPTETIIKKWPEAVIQFYEDRLYWENGNKISVGGNNKNKVMCKRKYNIDYNTEMIVGATTRDGEYHLVIQRKGSLKKRFIPSDIAKKMYPQFVINYYQQRLRFEDED